MTMKSPGWSFYKWLFLIAVLLVTFSPLFKADFIMDDAEHYYSNSLLAARSPDAATGILFSPNSVLRTYAPLTLWSFYIESLIFRFNPHVAHGINLVLHIFVIYLVVLLGMRLGLSRTASFVGGVIFAFHPMHIESFAWVTERKDVLYTFFYLYSLVLYCEYIDKKEGRFYILALLCAAMSVMSKAMALSLPLAVILVDWFKRRPFSWATAFDKVPFFVVIVPFAAITYVLNAREPSLAYSFNPLVWIWCATFYVEKFFLPVNISSLYSIPVPIHWFAIPYFKACVLAILGVAFLWVLRRSRIFVFAILFYVLSAFFLWRFDVWDYSAVADRFMYLPSLGFCFLLATGIEFIVGRYRGIAAAVLFSMAVVFIVYDYQLALTWVNCARYWDAAIAHNRRIAILYQSRAMCLYRVQEPASCKSDQQECLTGYFDKKGLSKEGLRRVAAHQKGLRAVIALSDLRKSLILDPSYAQTLNLVGEVMFKIGDHKKAFFFFDRVTKIMPGSADAWFNRGVFYADTSDLQKAVKDFDRAINLNPLFYDAYYQRAVVKVKLLQFGSALQDAWKLIEIAPNRRESYDMTTELSMRTGRPDIARKLLDQEIKLFPQYAFAYSQRSAVCELLGDKKQSEEDFRKAAELGRLGQASRTPLGQ